MTSTFCGQCTIQMAVVSRKRNRPEEWGDIEPSPVIHLSDLPEHTLEIDLEKMLQQYGAVREITIMPNKRQALVEFEDQSGADKVVARAAEQQFLVGNQRIRVAYSTSKRIIHRAGVTEEYGDERCPPSENNILLLTIYNAHYPINVDVIHQVANRHGKVLRIVVFRRKEVQAMVEFSSVAEARACKRHINGADIYSGCCSLKVEFAKQSRLSVTRNTSESWDYENPLPEYADVSRLRPAASLLGKFESGHPDQSVPSAKGPSEFPDTYSSSGPHGLTNSHTLLNALAMLTPGSSAIAPVNGFPYSDLGLPHSLRKSGSPVVMVYNLNINHMNCDRLFNLFCLYGNVGRIKFLRSKEGSAMVQMHDVASVDRALAYLPMITFAGQTLNGQPSRQTQIMDVPQPHTLPDGTESYKDFTHSRNNRYLQPESAAKNRIYPPSNVLHYWNCPPSFSTEEIQSIFANAAVTIPLTVTPFQKNDRSSSGLLEWGTLEEACEALIVCNHTTIPRAGSRFPFTMRLAFSFTSRDTLAPSHPEVWQPKSRLPSH
uniref:Heterogeneous nuclear ribonucleoprotein L n=2 Tax=Schistocephalus solidus TaxID=70667 RepID=A0A0X3PGT4_SCHSO